MFGRKRSPSDTADIVIKRKQIDSLKSHNNVTKEIEKDAVFEVTIPNFVLTVVLLPNYPNSPPTIYIVPPVTHPWVDSQMIVVGHPKLGDWSPSVNLGKMVKEIGKEFKHNPPKLLHRPSISGQSNMYPQLPQNHLQTLQAHQYQPSQTLQNQPQTVQSLPIQNIQISQPTTMRGTFRGTRPNSNPSLQSNIQSNIQSNSPVNNVPKPIETLPELANLTNQELQELLNDDTKFEQFLQGLEKYKNTENVAKEVKEENERVAANTLSKISQMTSLQEKYAKEHEQYKALKSEYESKSKVVHELMKAYSAQVIIGKIRVTMRKFEQESENTAESFLNGELDLNDFVEGFVEKKKKYHTTASKLEMVIADPSIFKPK